MTAFFVSNSLKVFIYRSMLELHIGQSGEKIIVTLTELQTLSEPYFLFRFTHVLTKNVVSLIKHYETDDESDFPDRYNQFDIDTAVVFANQPIGEWQYEVYEQVSSSNTDPAAATGLLENGKLYLYPNAGFDYEIYDQPVTFKTYNG